MTSPTLVYALAAERAAALEKMLRASPTELGLADAAVSWVVRTESTSDDAKAAAPGAGGRAHVFVADHQTKGRGRSGNAWVSDPGAGLLLSALLFPSFAPADAPRITLAIGAAIAERVDGILAKLNPAEADAPRVRVKWPNDLELGGKKLAGILVEAQTRGERLASIVVGVGLNVVPSYGDEEVAKRAASLTTTDHVAALDRADLAYQIVSAIATAVSTFERDGLAPSLAALAKRDALAGSKVRIAEVEGVAAGIQSDGALLVRTAAGDVPVNAGTVERVDA